MDDDDDFTHLIPEVFRVSPEQWEALMTLLEASPEPTPRLDALLAEPSRLDTPPSPC